MKLSQFPHSVHKNICNVDDFYNSISLKSIELDEIGGSWTGDDHLAMLEEAFLDTPVHQQQYATYKRQSDKQPYIFPMIPKDIEHHLREIYRDTLPRTLTASGMSLNTTGNVICRSCKQPGHVAAHDPKCPNHRADHINVKPPPANTNRSDGNTDQIAPENTNTATSALARPTAPISRPALTPEQQRARHQEWCNRHRQHPDQFPFINAQAKVCWNCGGADVPYTK